MEGLKTAIKTACADILRIQKLPTDDFFDDDAEMEQMVAKERRRFSVE